MRTDAAVAAAVPAVVAAVFAMVATVSALVAAVLAAWLAARRISVASLTAFLTIWALTAMVLAPVAAVFAVVAAVSTAVAADLAARAAADLPIATMSEPRPDVILPVTMSSGASPAARPPALTMSVWTAGFASSKARAAACTPSSTGCSVSITATSAFFRPLPRLMPMSTIWFFSMIRRDSVVA